MTPISSPDELIAAALHGDLSSEERAQFESRLQNDPAALAAYQEAQTMHDLLEKTHREAQPDPAFEQRMVSGVRRKIQNESQRETPWESLLFLWRSIRESLSFTRRPIFATVAVLGIMALVLGTLRFVPVTGAFKKAERNAIDREMGFAQVEAAKDLQDMKAKLSSAGNMKDAAGGKSVARFDMQMQTTPTSSSAVSSPPPAEAAAAYNGASSAMSSTSPVAIAQLQKRAEANGYDAAAPINAPASSLAAENKSFARSGADELRSETDHSVAGIPLAADSAPAQIQAQQSPVSATPPPPAQPSLKLIRNAQLDLEVKSFQSAMDAITAATKAAGGYVGTSNSEKGGNGKLQGMVVVKILPQNLDAFLLNLRDLGTVENQSVSAEDVTKEYVDTQSRLENSRRMETQLQDLLKHQTNRVSDLLQVERELARVRGDIEQMQGQLKLYDFQVQFATVTIQLKEKDLNQAAAYLLKEQDNFSLFALDVEATFKKARAAADDFKGQVLQANLNHNSGSDVSADLVVTVAPDQIEPFLDQIKSMGRVANFTRQTQRVAKDGGQSTDPADETRTEKDKVQVHVAIHSDDESRKQVSLAVVTSAVDDALEKAKAAALSNGPSEILSSSLNKAPEGSSTAQLSVRVPGKSYHALLEAFRALGRTSSFSLQRDDNSGPGANGDDTPVIVSLALTDDEVPLQETAMSVLVTDVEGRAQELKKAAATTGVEVKASNFSRQPNGTETAQMTFRLPLGKYPPFVERLKNLGKVESLTVQRQDRPTQTATDDDLPVEIGLTLHNEGDVVPDDTGLWATIRQTFGEGAGALFGSVKTIGVAAAFLAPWVFVLGLLAWMGRRIYIRRKNNRSR